MRMIKNPLSIQWISFPKAIPPIKFWLQRDRLKQCSKLGS